MDPELTKNGYPRLDCIVTVVDALRMRDEFEGGALLTRPDIDEEDIENLVIQQIEFCNIVLLNKAAEVTPDELGRIRSIVRTLQPKAEIIECNYGDVDFDSVKDMNINITPVPGGVGPMTITMLLHNTILAFFLFPT